ncbi:flagellar biosynthetic protein FliR [Salinisphaera sp. RV14]|uniref:flagellar biosynthetic protein FliR n=1 Tax=unclassified Salinisphaera TaxID=2649847 RepID=UPI003F85D1B6
MGWLGHFVWPFCRCSGLVLTAPVIGSRYTPARIRVLVGAALALVVAAAVPNLPPLPANPWQVMAQSGMNVLYGAALGFVMWVAVSAITVSGEMMGLSMALGFARLSAPSTGTSMPVLSEIMLWAGLMAYLAANGPEWVISALYHSFQTDPSGSIPIGGWHAMAEVGTRMFVDGLWLALPVVIAGLAVNAALGVITGLAPSLNVFSIGFPLLFLMGMWLLLSTMQDIQHVFLDAYQHATGVIVTLVGTG